MPAVARARAHARLHQDIARAHFKRMLMRLSQDSPQGTACVIANSVPKAGTHLLLKVLGLMPGMYRVRLPLYPTSTARFEAGNKRTRGDVLVPVGVARRVLMSAGAIESALSRLPPGGFTIAHVPHSSALAEVLISLGYRMVIMLRDPRDVAVSSADYLPHQPKNPFSSYFRDMSGNDRITASLRGMEGERTNMRLLGVRDRFESVLAWREEAFVVTVSYEELVGPQGGGSRQAQLEAIDRIARHIGLALRPGMVEAIASEAFGATSTFNAGRVGRWRQSFTVEHINVAGPLLADLLIDLGYETNDEWCR